jgi:hypothetical protein
MGPFGSAHAALNLQEDVLALRTAVSAGARSADADNIDPYVTSLDAQASDLAKSAVDNPNPSEDLSAFLRRTTLNILNGNEHLCATSDRKRLRDQIMNQVEQTGCSRCPVASALGHPCDGTNEQWEWSLILGKEGLCVAEILGTWQLAQDVAQRLYKDALPALPAVKIDFCVEYHYSLPPLGIPQHDLSYHAGVDMDDDAHTFCSRVTLKLVAQSYGLRCADVLLHVMLHEALCHVWQCAWDVRPRRIGSGVDSFAEGWMDFVVARVIESADGTPARPIRPREADAASRLHGHAPT